MSHFQSFIEEDMQPKQEKIYENKNPQNPQNEIIVINGEEVDSLEKREHIMYVFLLVTSLIIIIVNYFFYNYVKLDKNIYILSLIFTLVLPFCLNIYSVLWHIHYDETHTTQQIIEELEQENKLEKESKIPIILFGLGLFVTKLQKQNIMTIIPYLLVSLIFGTILPEFFITLIFDHKNVTRLTLVEEIDFSFIMLSYGFLVMSVIYTGLFYLRKNNITHEKL